MTATVILTVVIDGRATSEVIDIRDVGTFAGKKYWMIPITEELASPLPSRSNAYIENRTRRTDSGFRDAEFNRLKERLLDYITEHEGPVRGLGLKEALGLNGGYAPIGPCLRILQQEAKIRKTTSGWVVV